MFDVIIQHGLVYDGGGKEPVRCDVGIRRDRIDAVGDLSEAESRLTLSANGGLVCPGFIDAHTHSDAYLLIEPGAPSKLFQGVTTEVTGNCGASCAPLFGAWRMPSDWADKDYPGTWHTVGEYRTLLDSVRPAVNVYMLIGHNTLRGGAMGYENRPPAAGELNDMARWLEQSLDEGGRGLSSGLAYPPGLFAGPEEIQRLARVVAKHGGIYTSHMRSEGRHLIEAISETLHVGATTGVPVQISHLKTSGRAHWHKLDEALALIRQAQADGLRVAADRYPYTASCTDLDILFPDWAEEGGREAILARVRDPAAARKIMDEISADRTAEDWDAIMIGNTAHPDTCRYRGWTLSRTARDLGRSPAETVLHLLDLDALQTGGIFFGMSEENMWRILAEPYVMIGSDASIRAIEGPLSHDHPHPRAYGAHARFLRAALDHKTVSVAEAVRKMTALPAEHFGIRDRGVIATGRFADLVVIDPEALRDQATYAHPHQYATGIRHLLVNGVPTIRDGHPTPHRGGRFLEG
ncbi:MAG: D-aminoacylase [Spartobacteria bacterium]|nr:D-aminoacylase [Spartobacteria bacterium]